MLLASSMSIYVSMGKEMKKLWLQVTDLIDVYIYIYTYI